MIIGGSKIKVIENIKKNILANELNKKVEVNDPSLSQEETEAILAKFYKARGQKIRFFLKSRLAYFFIDMLGHKMKSSIEIVGLENLDNIKNGAIITSNHFNPLDNMVIREVIKRKFKKNMYIVSQETNLAMPGFLGYLLNNLNIIPLCKSPHYLIKTFKPELKRILKEDNYVLIYPEEEMWFNYRKPRPCKRGAYEFAAEANVTIISCFVQIIDTNKDDNAEFREVKYVVHVLKPIYLDPQKSIRENSKEMAKKDYEQKCQAYEEAYHKKLDYTFSYQDIAGFKKED